MDFSALFDPNDPDDIFYMELIPKFPIDPLLENLKEQVTLVKNYAFTFTEWTSFKAECLDYFREQDLSSFVSWSAPSLQSSKPYVMFDLNWQLITRSEICFALFLMFENTSVRIPHPEKNFWQIFPQPPDEEV